MVNALKNEIDTKIARLDNLYVQIKIHHERREYRMAALLFREVHATNTELVGLQQKLSLHKTVSTLNEHGVVAKVVKRPYECVAMG